MPRLRICGDPTVREAMARPGSVAAELVDDAGVGDAGPEPDLAVHALPGRELRHPGQVEQPVGPVPVEVQLDHHVGAAHDRHGAGVLGLGGERIGQDAGERNSIRRRPVPR